MLLLSNSETFISFNHKTIEKQQKYTKLTKYYNIHDIILNKMEEENAADGFIRSFANGSVDMPSNAEIFQCFFASTGQKNRVACKCGKKLYCDSSKSYSGAVDHIKSMHGHDYLRVMQQGTFQC